MPASLTQKMAAWRLELAGCERAGKQHQQYEGNSPCLSPETYRADKVVHVDTQAEKGTQLREDVSRIDKHGSDQKKVFELLPQ